MAALVPLIGCKTNPVIGNESIIASSTFRNNSYGATSIRRGSKYGWLRANAEPGDWIQFNFGKKVEIHKIETQSMSDGFVSRFKLSYSDDGTKWSDYGKEFEGGSIKNSLKKNDISPCIVAAFVRLWPTSCSGLGGALQTEMYGIALGPSVKRFKSDKADRNEKSDNGYMTSAGTNTHSGQMLQQMLHDKEFTDCSLVCGEVSYDCHRIVLAAASPVWRAAFGGKFREALDGRLTVEDAKPETVRALLKFVYTGDVDQSQIMSLLPLAHRYEIGGLLTHCLENIAQHISEDNVVETLSLMNSLMDHSEVSVRWPHVVKKIYGDRALLEIALRHVKL